MVKVLVTGASGYVGSHCVLELLLQKSPDYQVVALDNLCNSTRTSLTRVEELAQRSLTAFYHGSISDSELLKRIFAEHANIDLVIHFAALKAVGESVRKPLEYYTNNVSGTINLLNAMQENGVNKFIFSSSATVYGVPQYLPLDEKHPTGQSVTSPYGQTKCMVEQVLRDLCHARPEWNVISLRYFNPVGAHESGRIGEDPNDIPNNLMPFITQVAAGVRPSLSVFGNDYPTQDGTGVRDYIHIDDLATGHSAAASQIIGDSQSWSGFNAVNLGTGKGVSVLEMINSFQKVNNLKIPYKIVDRRPGDVAVLLADPKLANTKLNWSAKRSVEEACRSAWHWQSNNPEGYSEN